MKTKIFFTLTLILFAFNACDDQWTDDLVVDNKPEIPVTFPGSTSFGGSPYYEQPRSQDQITISVQIPENSPVKIAEISKIIAGTSSITPGNLMTATVASYIAAPIVVNGYSTTFTTSITEFNSKVAAASRIGATVNAPYTERAFMMLVTMEDGSQIIPTQIRIRITP